MGYEMAYVYGTGREAGNRKGEKAARRKVGID